MIVLDTCALLWLDGDRRKFSSQTLRLLDLYADALVVSSVSFLEVGMKANKGYLQLPASLDNWAESVCERYSLTVAPVTQAIAVHAAGLANHHKDPFDRIIISTALINKFRVVTADEVFRLYDGLKVVW